MLAITVLLFWVEVSDYWHKKVLFINFCAREQRLVAAAAIGLIAQLVAGNAIGGVAMRTDVVQGFGHRGNLSRIYANKNATTACLLGQSPCLNPLCVSREIFPE